MTATRTIQARSATALLLCATLVACGDSDLPQHHEEVLACAEREQAGGSCDGGQSALVQPTAGAATQATDGGSDGTDTDSEASVGAGAGDTAAGGDVNANAETDAGDTSGAGEPGETSDAGDAGDAVAPIEAGSDEPEPGAAMPAGGAGTIAPGAESIEGIDLTEYTLVFEDDFQGETLDYAKWKTALEWGPDLVVNGERQYYIDRENRPGFGHDAHVLDGETLSIVARRTPEQLLDAANDQPWLSGVISSAQDFDFQYGYAEARIDVPMGRALASSVWMLASDYETGGLNPRIFVAEHDGALADRLFHDYQYEDAAGNTLSPGQFEVNETGLQAGFHTVGVSWTPDELVYYVDGRARYRIVGEQLPQQRMYLILSLAIGGVSVDEPDDTTPERPSLAIDWVRVWQRNPG